MTRLAPVCTNCGATDFVWANDLKTGGLGGGGLSLRSRGELSLGTRICRACGHADLFLKDPSILKMPHTWKPGEFTPITPRAAAPPTHHVPAANPPAPSYPPAPPAPTTPVAPGISPPPPPPPEVSPPVATDPSRAAAASGSAPEAAPAPPPPPGDTGRKPARRRSSRAKTGDPPPPPPT